MWVPQDKAEHHCVDLPEGGRQCVKEPVLALLMGSFGNCAHLPHLDGPAIDCETVLVRKQVNNLEKL